MPTRYSWSGESSHLVSDTAAGAVTMSVWSIWQGGTQKLPERILFGEAIVGSSGAWGFFINSLFCRNALRRHEGIEVLSTMQICST